MHALQDLSKQPKQIARTKQWFVTQISCRAIKKIDFNRYFSSVDNSIRVM